NGSSSSEMFSLSIFFFLTLLSSIDSRAVVFSPAAPMNLSDLYTNERYVVPVEVPYKIKLPSKDVIQLGLLDAKKVFAEQRIRAGIAPEPQDIPEKGLRLESSPAGSYLWSHAENNNNVILAIHHEQPFELDFHLKSLSKGSDPAPKPPKSTTTTTTPKSSTESKIPDDPDVPSKDSTPAGTKPIDDSPVPLVPMKPAQPVPKPEDKTDSDSKPKPAPSGKDSKPPGKDAVQKPSTP
ncbi:hypothetical protein PFISCL1PPCAC_1606, partial [Pristionchus fissidentatus]